MPPDVEQPADPRPTIVFLHGTRLSGTYWAPQLVALGEQFHCLAPNLQGHGHSSTGPFTLDGAAREVAELIEREAHGRRAIVVGLSLGGFVAMALAAADPERVAGLAIAGATAEPVGWRALAFQALAAILSAVPEPILDQVNRRYFGWRYPAMVDPIVAGGFWFGGGAVAVRALVGEHFKPRLAAYPGPSLLINGEYDLFFRPTERSFAAVAAAPRRALIRRAGHLSNLDQPDQFSAAIRRFAEAIAG